MAYTVICQVYHLATTVMEGEGGGGVGIVKKYALLFFIPLYFSLCINDLKNNNNILKSLKGTQNLPQILIFYPNISQLLTYTKFEISKV